MRIKTKFQIFWANFFAFILIHVKAIPFQEKTGGGEENLRDPLGQNWDFFNPLAKNGYFPYPLGHKTGFFYPPRIFTPPQTVFLADFTPSDIFL